MENKILVIVFVFTVCSLMTLLPCSSDVLHLCKLIQEHEGRLQSEHRSDVYGYTQIKTKCQSTEGGMLKGKY